ncbi:MAG TPA: DUF4230 domain-containing protein [Polyangiaceae bacterium]
MSDARRPVLVLGILCAVLGLALAGTGVWLAVRDGGSDAHARPSNTLLLATRDMARLETTELHVEKVIDLTDTQSRLYGLVEGSDNVLLVAVGDVSLGVDLGKLGEGDVTEDEKTHAAHFRLPQPEVFSSRLDEKATYVYHRETSLFAKRNEQLESKARAEAQDTIAKQADNEDAKARARGQAEKILRELATSLGAQSVTFEWK